MPICEADPWRLQYFEGIFCPDDLNIPTEDADAWSWFPAHRWIYDKLRVAQSQEIAAAPHGVMPPTFPIFSKPIVNLRGMGVGSRVIATADARMGEAFTDIADFVLIKPITFTQLRDLTARLHKI